KALEDAGVYVIGPHMEENRAKAASMTEVVENVYRVLSERKLEGKKVLVIGGRSEEPIDSMRIITNRSSGRTAVSLAKAMFREGADVDLWMGGCDVPLPSYIPVKRFGSVADLLAMVSSIDHDIVIVPAALADFTPENKVDGKIPSDLDLELRLVPVEKVLPSISKVCPVTIGYKAESGLDRESLIAKARDRIGSYGLSAVIADDISAAGKGSVSAMFVTSDDVVDMDGTKDEVAEKIVDLMSGLN
ncbi:MAG: bifunctional phosphopantothenoylcysteine decarboxylase/phosphopantothenate--cysteine ligase CoaBC, partial [archaeon]|nr:bifunctional phosphopantothenoylcysteine decarboxylase/phosphopantothenate--cysteine ligase CoaBC [archaeon]